MSEEQPSAGKEVLEFGSINILVDEDSPADEPASKIYTTVSAVVGSHRLSPFFPPPHIYLTRMRSGFFYISRAVEFALIKKPSGFTARIVYHPIEAL
jgi:hypothetical protein